VDELKTSNLLKTRENRERLREWSKQQKIKNQLEKIAAVKAGKKDAKEEE